MRNKEQSELFVAFNKPLGDFLTPMDELKAATGELDAESTGLMILSERKKIPRLDSEYLVTVAQPISKSFLATLRTNTEPISIKKTGDKKFKIILFSDDLRRACEALGNPITTLKRIRLGPVKLKELGEGNWRNLTKKERQELENLL